MPCYHPLAGFRSKSVHPKTGKPLMFVGSGDAAHPGKEYIGIPCGRCIGCRLERSRQWALRCVHESKLYKDNCFITLTFRDDDIVRNHSLDKDDFVLFMKKLRQFDCRYRWLPKFQKYVLGHRFMWRTKSNVRFFHCGEYGEKLKRPHHHACLFNFDFKDKFLWSVRNGVRLYRSKALEKLWPYGFSTVGDVTFESAAYVARYVMKKINGDMADKHYDGLVPEYVTMSRKPGIGKLWFDKYKTDVYPHDYVVVNGHKSKPPRFYDENFLLTDKDEFEIIKSNRKEAAKDNPHNAYSRLRSREVVTEARVANLRRKLCC